MISYLDYHRQGIGFQYVTEISSMLQLSLEDHTGESCFDTCIL